MPAFGLHEKRSTIGAGCVNNLVVESASSAKTSALHEADAAPFMLGQPHMDAGHLQKVPTHHGRYPETLGETTPVSQAKQQQCSGMRSEPQGLTAIKAARYTPQ